MNTSETISPSGQYHRDSSQYYLATIKTLLTAFVASLILLTSPAYADTLHQGEDGVLYKLDGDINAAETAQKKTAKDKVESVLLEESTTSAQLDVIVYVLRGGGTANTKNEPRVSEIKVKHQKEMSEVSDKIRAIHKKYKPDWAMGEFEEQQHMEVVELAMTDSDRAELKRLKSDIDKRKDDMRRQVGQAINRLSGSNLQTVARFIISSGGSVTARIPMANALGAKIPAELLTMLADHQLVDKILKSRPVEYELDVSVPSVAYSNWWYDSIDGDPFDFGIVDTGVVEDHPAFSCVNSFYSRPGNNGITAAHGTHVTGIAVSCDSTFQGGIQNVDAVIWSTSNGQDVVMSNMDWMVTSPIQTPEVINHSLGYGIANVDDYNDNDSFYDEFIDNFDVMVTKSTGNKGWNDLNPTITHPAPAFNLMAVANMNDSISSDRSDDIRNTTSSVGPTVNGRKKPDITAPGTSIMSTFSDWNNQHPPVGLDCGMGITDNRDFVDCSGTSMAAPHVAAAIVLMEDGGNNIPMAQKAVLINTADAWDSNDTSSTADDGQAPGSHWDKSYGWGYLDMHEAHFNKDDYFIDSVVARNDNNTADDYKLYKGIMTINEKTTLTWHKRAKTYVAGLPSTGRYALTDINLRLYDEGNGVLEGQDVDGDDNVHQVAADHTSSKVIKVYTWSTSIGGLVAEPFALATEENFVSAAPPGFTHNYTRPNYVGPNQIFDITARIINIGDVAAHSNSMTLTNITGAAVMGSNTVVLPSITSGGGVQQHDYIIETNGISAGEHWFPLSVTSNSYLETYSQSWPGSGPVGGVSIIVETTPPSSNCTSPAYANGQVTVNWTASDWQTGVQRTYLYVKAPSSRLFAYSGQNQTGTKGNFNLTLSTQGLYQFAVSSIDVGNNSEGIPTVAECETFYDTVNPASTLNTPTYYSGSSIPLAFNVTDVLPSSGLEFVDFWYSKDGGAWSYTGQSSTSMTGTVFFTPAAGDGQYDFASRAKDNAQNIENKNVFAIKDSSLYDTISPIGSIIVNTADSITDSLDVKLTLFAKDAGSGISAMQFSSNNSTWSLWQAYSTLKLWNLSSFGGDSSQGFKTAYVRYRDTAGNISIVYSDSIEYALDSDGDSLIDRIDNCTLVHNPAQRDTDADGFGNYCDADFNNDLAVNFADLGYMKSVFFTPDAEADLNGDGAVNFADLGLLKSMFFQPPGPSGLVP